MASRASGEAGGGTSRLVDFRPLHRLPRPFELSNEICLYTHRAIFAIPQKCFLKRALHVAKSEHEKFHRAIKTLSTSLQQPQWRGKFCNKGRRRIRMQMSIFFTRFFAIVAILLASGCGGSDDSESASISSPAASGPPAPPAIAQVEAADSAPSRNARLEGYAKATAIWPTKTLKVCWVMEVADFAGSEEQRLVVQRAVAQTWSSVSQVRFTSWARCTGSYADGDIKIAVEDNYFAGPRAYIGTQGYPSSPSMWLNFKFQSWPCYLGINECTRLVAVHEFGHALGFFHEQIRPDTPNTPPPGSAISQDVWDDCRAPRNDPTGDTLIGAWDLSSVMNYCNPKWMGEGKLSPTDVAMVQKYYGVPVNIVPILLTLLDD